ncbi:DUF1656 domain-containing protein [Pseudomonas aeruginosa]|uniref:DUF1656 domain-containing protein n=1 Tax=Pseudomonas aeruginosa TaxID=287 RepID=UPI001D4C37EB|nr:DUF1656 domain-containing protein [Gammaproteobacteria bacterium]MBU2435448.1 DUF1656 domain-containing protein [Gammaproteobacteria bacterium]MCO2550205.1 DUF1656 domain-containing protein [Pseudomonas aeruginosa]WCY37398.1 DUF1656 domain-containing protein [Pseudomonas aeruginosa]WCY43164.1 DUF1656 domain-containing protein [Pseudomonas aeruginosa]
MLSEFSVAGIYIPPLLFYIVVAWLLFLAIRPVLARTGVIRLFWHPALFEFSLLVSIIAAFVLLF